MNRPRIRYIVAPEPTEDELDEAAAAKAAADQWRRYEALEPSRASTAERG